MNKHRQWLAAVTNPDVSGLPGRILSCDYLGQQAWRRVEVLRNASRQLRTFHRP